MLNYCEYLNLYGLSFKIGFDCECDTEWNKDCKIIFAVDFCNDPVLYTYWGSMCSFVGDL